MIYFIEAGDFIKIGYVAGDNPARLMTRIAELQVGNPYPLRVLFTIPGELLDERIIHTQFRKYRHRGEWFRRRPELVKAIEKFRQGHSHWEGMGLILKEDRGHSYYVLDKSARNVSL